MTITSISSAYTDAPSLNEQVRAPLLAAIGGRVKQERARQRLSRRVLSERCGVSERFLTQLEHGSGNISIMRLKSIADALGLSLAALVDDGTPREPSPVSDWRAHPGAIAELYRHAGAREQALVVELLVSSCRRVRAF